MAQLDADAVGGAVQRMDEGRAAGMVAQARRLAGQRVLAATDVLCLLASFDLLHAGRGPPAAETAQLLITTAERSLCR
jgi:hypothetical protein